MLFRSNISSTTLSSSVLNPNVTVPVGSYLALVQPIPIVGLHIKSNSSPSSSLLKLDFNLSFILMYHYVIGSSILKNIKPFIRKNVLQSVTSYDFLFINTLFISLFYLIVFIYKSFYDKNSETIKCIKNLNKETIAHVNMYLRVLRGDTSNMFNNFKSHGFEILGNEIVVKGNLSPQENDYIQADEDILKYKLENFDFKSHEELYLEDEEDRVTTFDIE